MDSEHGETMTVEAIEWPFLKAKEGGGDPAVSGTGPPSNTVVGEEDMSSSSGGGGGGAGSNGVGENDRYEIVVSSVVNADDLKHEHALQFGTIDGTATVR